MKKKSYILRCNMCADIVLAGEIAADARIVEGTAGFCVTCRVVRYRPSEMTLSYGKPYPKREMDLLTEFEGCSR